MSFFIQLHENSKIALRNPQETELGRKILSKSIELIDQLGFENFTFRELAEGINSTQASVYRYFENKHMLLLYITSWYWTWLEYDITFKTQNINCHAEQIKIIIKEIAHVGTSDPNIPHIDEAALYRIVISESAKAYLHKDIDHEVNKGYFKSYSSLCEKIAAVIKKINPNYPYALTLASNLIETAHEQSYFALHLPAITDISESSKFGKKQNAQIQEFLMHLIDKLVIET